MRLHEPLASRKESPVAAKEMRGTLESTIEINAQAAKRMTESLNVSAKVTAPIPILLM